MSDSSKIEWTEATWNPVTGCSKVSQGCKNCYALRDWKRLSANPKSVYYGREFTDVRRHEERLSQPLHWTKPRRIFVNSMSDLFHESVPDLFIGRVFNVMGTARQHTFQVLTKRPERMAAVVAAYYEATGQKPFPNVWLGVSIEDQSTADERIVLLLRTPAAVRFISYEPALGAVDLTNLRPDPLTFTNALGGASTLYEPDEDQSDDEAGVLAIGDTRLDWVIVGGESGPGAREFHVEWARAVIKQCRAAQVPVFVKQLGAKPMMTCEVRPGHNWTAPISQKDRKGGDPNEWPRDLRVREYPKVAA